MTSRIRQRGLGSTQSLLKKRRHSHQDTYDTPSPSDTHGVSPSLGEPRGASSFGSQEAFSPPFAQSSYVYPRASQDHFDFTGWGLIISILLVGKVLWLTYYLHLFDGSISYTLLFISIALMILGSFLVLGNRWRGERVSMRENESIDIHNPDGPPGGLSPQAYGNVLSDSLTASYVVDPPGETFLHRDFRDTTSNGGYSQW